MSEIVLYQYPGGDGLPSMSPPCVRVWLALKLMGLPFTVNTVSTPMEVKKVSTTGRVPAIRQEDGTLLCDSVRILDTLEATYPDQAISPRDDPSARARDLVWELYANDSLYWTAVYLRWLAPGGDKKAVDAMFPTFSLVKLAVSFGAPRMLRQRAEGQGIGHLGYTEVLHLLERHLGLIQDGLAGGPFLEGRDRPGRGDLAIAATTVQFGWRETGLEGLECIKARPGIREHTIRTFEACAAEVPPWIAG